MKVTACVVSFNTAEHLPGALESLLAQTHPDLHIVVVDNSSHDGSAEVARRYRDVQVVANADNRGFAGGANQGVTLTDDGAFFVLNPDVRLAPDHIERAVAVLQSDDRIASVQGRLWRMTGTSGIADTVDGFSVIDTAGHTAHTNRVFRNRGEGIPDTGQFDDPCDIFGVSGCAAMYRRAALDDIALDGEVFDEDMFAFFEDLDVDWRLRARGWRSRYVPDATGLHERGGNLVRRSSFVERLSYRNWFLLVAKNDDLGAMLPHAHLLAATTLLRTADIVITEPAAFARAVGDARLLARMRHKRTLIDVTRTVENHQIVSDWFGDFDYRDWFQRRIARSRQR